MKKLIFFKHFARYENIKFIVEYEDWNDLKTVTYEFHHSDEDASKVATILSFWNFGNKESYFK